MRIAYLDLAYPDFCENYTLNPSSYGGGRSVPVALKQSNKVECDIWAREEAFFNNNGREIHIRNKTLTLEQQQAIRSGAFIDLKSMDYDILVHHFSDVFVNTNVPQVTWIVGYRDAVNSKHRHLAYYNSYQNPIVYNQMNTYRFVLGTKIPDLKPVIKDNFIFQCSRHTPTFGSIEVAKLVLKLGIRAVFAGPMDKDYPLLDYVDNFNIVYLGQISESEKISLTERAVATTYLHSWPTPMNLSALQSIAHGTPVITTDVGFWRSLVRNNINGFVLDNVNEDAFLNAFLKCRDIDREKCRESVLEYSEEKMVDSFIKVCDYVLSHENT